MSARAAPLPVAAKATSASAIVAAVPPPARDNLPAVVIEVSRWQIGK
jgi:hypothetical protein